MTSSEKWLNSVYSDGSSFFLSNPYPKKGESTDIFLQVQENSPVTETYLLGKINGVSHPQKMEPCPSKNGLKRFKKQVTIYEDQFSYYFFIVTPKQIYYYTQEGITNYIPDEARCFRIITDFQCAQWVKNAVFYQIFPERFFNGNPQNDVKDGEYTFDGFPSQKIKDWNKKPESYSKAHCLDFYGGDLEGIKQKIPYLKKLGITALYLNPIFYAATVHKYDCLDYFQVDPHFGGDKALEELTEALHKNGIKIILDVSINHTGTANRWFNKEGVFFPKTEGAYNNPNSEEREYYFFNKDNTYKAWFDVPTLPTLNYTSEKLCQKIYKAPDSLIKKWLKPPYNIDGWRFDVGDTVARNNYIQLHHKLWPEIRKSIKEENPDAYIIAEDWTDCSEFLNGNEWDSSMNYYASCRPIRCFYGQQDVNVGRIDELKNKIHKMTAKELSAQITGFLSRLPYAITQLQFNLLDSHDVARFHNDPAVTKQDVQGAAILLFTLPGCANVYYGDEAEIDGTITEVEGCRYPMPWSKNIEQTDSFKLYSKLASIKTGNEAFKEGGFKILWNEGYVIAFARFTPSQVFITVCSNDTKNQTIKIPLEIFGSCFKQIKPPKIDALGQKINCKVKKGTLLIKVPSKDSFLISLD